MTNHFFGDTAVLLGRSLRHITRSPDTIITTTVMPIAMLLLFVYVFGGAIDSGSDSYVEYLLPGILLITIASGIAYTAFRLFTDMQSGIFERFQSMPIARSSVLWAHVLTSVVANLISLVVVVLVALLMGFRSGAGVLAWLAVAGILILFTLMLTWIAVIPGLSAKSADGVSAFSYPLILLPFISSAFVPDRHHARPGARLRRAPAGDVHRQRHPRPVHRSSRSAPTSGSLSPGVSASSSSRTASPWSRTAAGSPSSRRRLGAATAAPAHSRPASGPERAPCNTAALDNPLLGDQVLESSVELSIPEDGIVFDGLVLRLPTIADLDRMPRPSPGRMPSRAPISPSSSRD